MRNGFYVLALLFLALFAPSIRAQYQYPTYQGYGGAYYQPSYQPYYYRSYLVYPKPYYSATQPAPLTIDSTIPSLDKLSPDAIDSLIQELTKRKASLLLPVQPIAPPVASATAPLTAEEIVILQRLLKKLGEQPK